MTTSPANNFSPPSVSMKAAEDAYAEQIYKKIMDNNGNLVNDPQLHVIVAMLNIDVSELVERKPEYFKEKQSKSRGRDMTTVHHEYYK